MKDKTDKVIPSATRPDRHYGRGREGTAANGASSRLDPLAHDNREN